MQFKRNTERQCKLMHDICHRSLSTDYTCSRLAGGNTTLSVILRYSLEISSGYSLDNVGIYLAINFTVSLGSSALLRVGVGLL